MHLLRSTALCGLIALTGCASSVPFQQQRPAGNVAVARFLLDVDGLEADFPDQGGGLLPAVSRARQTARDVIEAGETIAHPEGSVVKAAIDSVYAALAAGITEEMNLTLLPIDALRGEVRYLVGAPMGQARDVSPSDDYAYVLETDVSVEVPDAVQGSWSFLGTGRAKVQGHPEMTVVVRMVDAAGQVVWRDQTRVRSREKVYLDERWLLGFRTSQDVSDASSLPALMHRAVSKMVRG